MRLIILAFVIFPLIASAQNYVDIAKLSFSSTPANKLKDDSLSTNSSVQLIEFSADLTTPIVLKNKNVIVTGLVYEQTNLKTSNSNNLVYTINPKLGYKKSFSENFSSTFVLLPKLSSNLKNINSKHIQFGGIALFEKIKTSKLKYKFGMYYNQELFGSFTVPLFGFYYKSENNKLEANFTLPVYAAINYKLNSWLNSGVTFNSSVKSYYLGNENNTYLTKTSNEVYALLQCHSKASRLVLETQIGYSIGRSYRIYDESDKIDFGFSAFKFGDNREQLNQDFKDGLIFKVRLLYRFMIDNN